MSSYAKAFMVLSILVVVSAACTVNGQPQKESPQLPDPTRPTLVKSTSTPTIQARPTSTPRLDARIPKPTATPTTRWQVRVIEIVPAIQHVETAQEKWLSFAAFTDDAKAVYGFVTGGFDSAQQTTHWSGYDLSTRLEVSATAPIKYDASFWNRNRIQKIAFHPELAGYFSPSGRYVIYNVWYGSVFDKASKTEIWVAETHGQRKFKIFEFGYSNVYIYRAAWFADESKVIFNTTYEGPTEFYIADIPSRKTVPLSAVTDFDGATEDTWRLSPDGKTLAVVAWDRRLLLVSLETGKLKTVEKFGGTFPTWSADGKRLYYWWGADKDNWYKVTELRAYDLLTETISTLVDKPSLVQGFRDYEGDNVNITSEYYMGAGYAISSSEDKILLWSPGLYWVTLHNQP